MCRYTYTGFVERRCVRPSGISSCGKGSRDENNLIIPNLKKREQVDSVNDRGGLDGVQSSSDNQAYRITGGEGKSFSLCLMVGGGEPSLAGSWAGSEPSFGVIS